MTREFSLRKPRKGFIRFTTLPIFVLFLLLSGTWPPTQAQAAGGISISPKRIVLEGRTRSAEIMLINTSTQPTTYRVLFQNLRMTEDGILEVIQEPGPGDLFADKLIRYAPREITVPAGGSQTVRLMLRKPRDLPEGEYRSHLLFKALPSPEEVGGTLDQQVLEKGELKVKMVPIFSISIPIIVRHGDLSAEISMSDLALQSAGESEGGASQGGVSQLSFQLHRKGTRSVYGDITVTYKPKGGDALEVGLVRGIAIYVPTASRSVVIPLTLPEGVELKGGSLQAVFKTPKEKGGDALAEARLTLP